MRITLNYIKKFCIEQFKKYDEMYEYEIVRVERTKYKNYDYESGACHIQIFFKHKESNSEKMFMGFYSLKDYQYHIDNGFELYLKFDRYFILTNTELELRKK